MLGVDLDGSRRIEPAQVGRVVGPDGSRRIEWVIIGMIKRIRHNLGWQGKRALGIAGSVEPTVPGRGAQVRVQFTEQRFLHVAMADGYADVAQEPAWGFRRDAAGMA